MTEQLTIQRLGHRGDGIADTAEGAVFVPYTLPGETVTVEPAVGHPDRRHLSHVDKPSQERAVPICKHFGQCGGCAMEHWSLAEYHLWKRELVVEALAQAGLLAPVEALIGVFDKIGVKTGIDFFDIADAAEDVVRPAMPAECLLDRNALIMGYSGVYSSFLKHAVRQAERYGVPAHQLLHRAGQRKLIGGQEDQLIDIALEIKREQAASGQEAATH